MESAVNNSDKMLNQSENRHVLNDPNRGEGHSQAKHVQDPNKPWTKNSKNTQFLTQGDQDTFLADVFSTDQGQEALKEMINAPGPAECCIEVIFSSFVVILITFFFKNTFCV